MSNSGHSLMDRERNPSAGLLQCGQVEHFLQRLEKMEVMESEVDEKVGFTPEVPFTCADSDGEDALALET